MTWRATWAAPFDETREFASEREAEEWAEEVAREDRGERGDLGGRGMSETCELWGCDGSGRSKQGWSANYGDQYGPCGRRCEKTEMTKTSTDARGGLA